VLNKTDLSRMKNFFIPEAANVTTTRPTPSSILFWIGSIGFFVQLFLAIVLSYRFSKADISPLLLDDPMLTLFLTSWVATLLSFLWITVVSLQIKKHHQLFTDENRTIIDSVPAMIWYKDTQNNIVRCNTLAAQTKGLTVAEMEGHHTSEFYPNESDKYWKDDLEVIHSGNPKLGIVEIFEMNEKKTWIRTDKVPYKNSKGQVVGVIVFATDITIASQAAEEKIELIDELKKAITSRDDFLGIASHELKSPITALQMQLELLKNIALNEHTNSPSYVSSKNILDSSLKQVARLTKLIEEMLDLSRIDSNKIQFKIDRVNLHLLVQGIVGQHSANLDSCQCKIDLQVPRNLFGHWDKTRLEQVLVNLLSNATKYAPGSQVTIKAFQDASHTTLMFQDTGPGIEKKNLEIIFKRYEQINPLHKATSMGLGLYICKQILKAHHGDIWAESEPGQGTTFVIKIPTFYNKLSSSEKTEHKKQGPLYHEQNFDNRR